MGWRRWDREAEMGTRVWKLSVEGGEEWDEVRWSRVGGGVKGVGRARVGNVVGLM